MKRRAAFDDRQLTRASVIAIAGLVRCEACGARRSRSRIVSWCERNTQMEPQNSAPTRRSARLAAGAPEERITLAVSMDHRNTWSG